MNAIVYHQYGGPDVLKLGQIAVPPVADDAVLVRVRGAAVNPYDWHFMRGEPYFMRMMSGVRAPKRQTLGLDFAGEVAAVGKNVTRFEPGDPVYGMQNGAFAEYVACPEEHLARKPERLPFEEAAAVPLAAVTALQGLGAVGQLQPGERVLIIGASGGVGTFAVQIAREMNAHVTGVCSTRNVDLVHELGADAVIDYTREDFTRGSDRYDLIFQLGGEQTASECRRALTPTGRLILSSGESDNRWIGPLGRIMRASIQSRFVGQSLMSLEAKRSGSDLSYLAELIDDGKLMPIIDHQVELAQVPEAIAYVEKAHSRGKVVVCI